ncbi:MAG: hypothetical protein EB121_01835, partial [Alphaproteobacteria bacterium]|nr:hypothetical protein [Alphaproteobacteria bacterium]
MVDPVVEAAVSSLGKRGPAKSGPPLGNAKKMAKAQRFLAARGIDPAQLASSFGSTGGSSSLTSQPVMSMDELKASIGKLVASMPKDPVKNDSSWAKGLGLVGKALNVIDIPRSYVASKVSTLATGLEEGDPTKVLGALPVIGEAVNVVDNFGGDPNAPKGLLNKVLFADQQQSKDFYNHTGTGEYLQRGINKHGWQGTPLDNAWVKRLIGLAGDIGLDPLTYATLGAGAAVEAPAKAAATVGAKAAVEATAEQGAKQLVKAGAEQVAKEAGTASSKVLGQVAEQVGKTVAKDAGERAAKQAVVEVGEIAADIGTRKSRVLRGWKEISDHIFEQARALGKDDPMRAQLENMGAKIRKARSTWVASNAELADAGVKRGVWLVGSRNPLGQESRVLEGVLRAKEMVGGGLRKAVSDPAAKLLEGTFGEERQNMLRKMARSGIGEAAQIGVSALAFNKDARHTANGMMLDLARGFGKALDMADKAGIDGATLTRAVQDPTVFEELAARTPKAAEAILAVRDEFAKARNMYEAVTKVALPDNPLYMPRRMTSDAWDLINSKPEFKAEMSGPAAFTQARTLRSGQDNAAREVEKQSTVFLGAEVPRNLSDAQVTDWANARYKQIFGDQAPQLFETDPRKLIDSYLSEFKRQMQQDMFTVRWLDAGFGSEQAQKAWNIVGGGKERVTAVADQFMGKVAEMKQKSNRLFDQLDRMMSGLAQAKSFSFKGMTHNQAVKELRLAREELAQGNFQRLLNFAEFSEKEALVNARRASADLAKRWQDYADTMHLLRLYAEDAVRSAGENLDRFGRNLPFGAVDMQSIERGASAAAKKAADGYVPTAADEQVLKTIEEAAAGRVTSILNGEDLILPNGTGRPVGTPAEIEKALRDVAGLSSKEGPRSFGPATEAELQRQSRLASANDALARLQSEKPSIAALNRYKSNPAAYGRMMDKVNETYRQVVKERLGLDIAGFEGDIRKATPDEIKQAVREQILADQRRVASENAYNTIKSEVLAKEVAPRAQRETNLAWDYATKQRRYEELLPLPVREETERFFAGNKQAAVLNDYAVRQYLAADLLRQGIDNGMIVADRVTELEASVRSIEDALSASSHHMAGDVVDATTQELKRAINDYLGEINQFSTGAKRDLADWLRLEAGVVDMEGQYFLGHSFNKSARKEAPRSISRGIKGGLARDARRSSRAAEGGINKLLQMDAEGQILPMLQNVIARSALSEGFKSL